MLAPRNLGLPEIPDAKVIRERLAQTLREASILRRQLRLSERAAEERLRRINPSTREVVNVG